MNKIYLFFVLSVCFLRQVINSECHPCYKVNLNHNCVQIDQTSALHMIVQFKIKNSLLKQCSNNKCQQVIKKCSTANRIMMNSYLMNQKYKNNQQSGHRIIFSRAAVHFLQSWVASNQPDGKSNLKKIFKDKYWELLGGSYTAIDSTTHYEDIIGNFEKGLDILQNYYDYRPSIEKGNLNNYSPTLMVILTEMGYQGYLINQPNHDVEMRQFVWQIYSSNKKIYGYVPTIIYNIQNINQNKKQSIAKKCPTDQKKLQKIKQWKNKWKKQKFSKDNNFLYIQTHQQINYELFSKLQSVMYQQSLQKCQNIYSFYSTLQNYFKKIFQGQSIQILSIIPQTQSLITLNNNILLRNISRFIQIAHKAHLSSINSKSLEYEFLNTQLNLIQTELYKNSAEILTKFQQFNKALTQILSIMFELQYPINTNNPLCICISGQPCQISENLSGILYLKVFNSIGIRNSSSIIRPIVLNLPLNQFYGINQCTYEIMCQPNRNCKLILYPSNITTYNSYKLFKIESSSHQQWKNIDKNSKYLQHNSTHLCIKSTRNRQYYLSYKIISTQAVSTSQTLIIQEINQLQSNKSIWISVSWSNSVKTILINYKHNNKQWQIQTMTAETNNNVFLQINTNIDNDKYYIDNNGWIIVQQKVNNLKLYHVSSFIYILNKIEKVSINVKNAHLMGAYKSGQLLMSCQNKSTIFMNYQNQHYRERIAQILIQQPSVMQLNLLQPNQRIQEYFMDINALQTSQRWNQYLKLMIKIKQNSNVILRIHNLHDENKYQLSLHSEKIRSALLSVFYGTTVQFTNMKQMTIDGNQLWSSKNNHILKNRKKQYDEQRKIGQKIIIEPLQIRTFKLSNVNFKYDCKKTLPYSLQQVKYNTDVKNNYQQHSWQKQIRQYLLKGDHCDGKSPIGISSEQRIQYNNPIKQNQLRKQQDQKQKNQQQQKIQKVLSNYKQIQKKIFQKKHITQLEKQMQSNQQLYHRYFEYKLQQYKMNVQ